MKKSKILFIDTETGGLDPNSHSLLSLGMVVWDNYFITSSKEIFINDGILNATEEALNINKIDLDFHKLVAISPKEAIEQIKTFIQENFNSDEKVTLAGHNINFDVNFLKKCFHNENYEFNKYFSYRTIDTSAILHYLYLGGVINHKAISLDQACNLFGINIPNRHTALDDTVATANLFTKLLKMLQ